MSSREFSGDAKMPDVRDDGHARKLRLPYETPRIEVIDLTAQEVLGGCVKVFCGGMAQSLS